jgi:hypothetical protein
MYPLLLQDIAAEHVRDMQASATASRRARRTRRDRRGLAGLAWPAGQARLIPQSAAFHR